MKTSNARSKTSSTIQFGNTVHLASNRYNICPIFADSLRFTGHAFHQAVFPRHPKNSGAYLNPVQLPTVHAKVPKLPFT